MKFILKETALDPLSRNPVQDYLRSLDISKTSSFTGAPPQEDEEDYKDLNHIDEGVEMLHKHLEKDGNIFLQVD